MSLPASGLLTVSDLSEWRGKIVNRVDPGDAMVIEMPVKPSPRGGSGTFLAAGRDGTQWWVKPLNNNQGPRVPITEAIVSIAGQLIGAPVCDADIVYLPPDIEGWEFRRGAYIEAGYAHASKAVPGAVEHRQLLYRDRDENSRRHVGLFALYDWCWGGDEQWLYSEMADRETFSHDHGWYLPEVGPSWDVASLQTHVNESHMPSWPTDALDAGAVVEICDHLRALSQPMIAEALADIPASWPVEDEELECVGWFLENRASHVAGRVETLGGGS